MIDKYRMLSIFLYYSIIAIADSQIEMFLLLKIRGSLNIDPSGIDLANATIKNGYFTFYITEILYIDYFTNNTNMFKIGRNIAKSTDCKISNLISG